MKILIAGDYIAYDDFTHHIRKINYDVSIFGTFIDIIKSCDFSIYNQEFPLTNSENKYPTKVKGGCYKALPDSVKLMENAGFTHATLANNHILDYGIEGLRGTIDSCNKSNIITMGAGENLEKAQRIHYLKNNGITVAIINITENEYSVASDKHGGACPLDLIDNIKLIIQAKEKSDFVFIISHGGIDFCNYPSERLVKQFHFFAEMGASASHVTSGFEVYNGTPIFYDIGGFIPGRKIVPDCIYNYPVVFNIKNKEEISFTGYPLKFDFNNMKMYALAGEELKYFNDKQQYINCLIKEPKKLKQAIMNDFLNEEKTASYFNLLTRSHLFWFRLFRKFGLMKLYYKFIIISKNKKNRINTASWNLIRCETHKDILSILYEKYFDTYRNEVESDTKKK